MHDARPEEWVESRGIYRAPHLRDGAPLIIAIDSRSRLVAGIALHRGLSPSGVRRTLTEILDAVDPVYPRLHCEEAPAARVDSASLVRLLARRET